MPPYLKSFTIGVMGSVAVLALSTYTLAISSAFAKPSSVPMPIWEWLVVFGLGAALVAFVVQLVAVLALKAQAWPALAGFALSMAVILLVSGLFPTSSKALVAWLAGALLAAILASVIRRNAPKAGLHKGNAQA